MRDRQPSPVPDYTGAFLATLGLILFMAFWTIASVAGFVWVVFSAALIDRAIWAGARLRQTR